MGWLSPAAIRTRREAERDLFRDGRYPTGTIPVWAVDRNGQVDFSRPVRLLTEAEALAFLRPTSQPVPLPVPLPVPTQPPATRSWWQRLMEFLKGKASS
jgi:lysozyme